MTSPSVMTDPDAFAHRVEQYRNDLVVLCYRFLGSLQDAEDAAQETALRAWRGRETYRGDASMRTWLHRIATRVCLDAIERRGRRHLPPHLAQPADPEQSPAPPSGEILWLEPLPDSFVADASLDPQARYSLRESVSLAFTAALQLLPPRQRAVLLLRDVLCWRASEVARILEMTESAVSSALNRARTRLRAELHQPDQEPIDLSTAADSRLLDAYMRAWETDNIDGLVGLLREEVRLAMPPSPAWYQGRSAVGDFLRNWVLPMGPFRMRPTGANLQAAAVLLLRTPGGGEQPVGVHVLSIERGRISAIDAFMDPVIAARFTGVTQGDRPRRDGLTR